MITPFTDEQLDAASRLTYDSDFKILIHYLVAEVTKLSLQAVRTGGEEKERISGACLGLEEFRDILVTAPDVIKRRKENSEALIPERDLISP